MSKLLLRAQDLLQRPMQRQQAMAFIKTARQIRRKNPGTQWMVGVIFDLDPQDEIFQKSFKAPSRERTQNPKFQAYFKDYDGFWEGLPVNDNLDQPGQKRSIGVPKNQRLKQKF